MKMKFLLLVLLAHSLMFSQTKIVPIENKHQYLYNNDVTDYYFKDTNNKIDNFTGKWRFVNDSIVVELDAKKVLKKVSGNYNEDGIQIYVKLTKNSKVTYWRIIDGGFFDIDNSNKFNVILNEEIEKGQKMICGHCSIINLNFDANSKTLLWNIENKELRFNKTAKLFPNRMVFNYE